MNIEELYKNGTIKYLFDKGIVSPKVMIYFQYKATFMTFRASMSYRESCERAAESHSTSVESIKRAIKVLKQ